MGSAISIGQTGLAASSRQMEVIANNLANSNTVGFKASSTLFASIMNQGLSNVGSLATGQGVKIANVATQYTQGSFETTGNATDMAIDGDGFFIVNDPSIGTLYTRVGSFHIDKNNNLVDSNGYKVQGYMAESGVMSSIPSDIQLQMSKNATTTTEISFGANLSETTAVDDTYNVSMNVYDSKGAAHALSITFTKTDVGEWGYAATFDSVEIDGFEGSIAFDGNGVLVPPADDVVIAIDPDIVDADGVSILKGATIGVDNEINWALLTDTTRKLTGYSSGSIVNSLSSDGFSSGNLKSLSVDTKGVISGTYSNGEVVEMSQISLANFADQSTLKKNGNYFGETTNSGKPTINAAGSAGLGEIQSNSLEGSNTDVSKEFINMITAQRAYQANAKIITTSDQMLTELMNIKR
jgi:flagellar hook protein FlgE